MAWYPSDCYEMSVRLGFSNLLVDKAPQKSQKIITDVYPAFGVSFLAIPKASKIAQSSASSISLFSPRKPLLSFHRPSLVSLQQTAARTFPLSSLNSSVHRTKLVLPFIASSRACFLGSITMSSLIPYGDPSFLLAPLLLRDQLSAQWWFPMLTIVRIGLVVYFMSIYFLAVLLVDTLHLLFSN